MPGAMASTENKPNFLTEIQTAFHPKIFNTYNEIYD